MDHKIYITGCAGIPARYGGFETFAEQISKELINNFDICVCCSTKFYNPGDRDSNFHGIKRKFIATGANSIQSLLYDFISISIAAGKADTIIHLGGGAGISFLLLKPFVRGKIWIHTDGLEGNRKKWQIMTRWFLRINIFLSYWLSHKIIIDNQALVKKVPERYRKKILLIKYGGERNKSFYSLTIARAEPENNLHTILEAFKNMQDQHIHIISNWNRTRYGRSLYNSFNTFPNIDLHEAIYHDPLKLQEYRANSSLYLHGHSVGGTNPSLVEAMYSGIPVVAHDNPYNRATTKNSALYFETASDIISILSNLDTKQLSEISNKMSAIAHKEYLWENIAGSLMQHLLIPTG